MIVAHKSAFHKKIFLGGRWTLKVFMVNAHIAMQPKINTRQSVAAPRTNFSGR